MEQAPIPRDCAIIIKNAPPGPNGETGIEIGLVMTRKQDDQSPDTEAEAFGKFAVNAVAKLYQQLNQPAPQPQSNGHAIGGMGQHIGNGKFGAPDPSARFQPPTIVPGEERDMKELHDKRKKR